MVTKKELIEQALLLGIEVVKGVNLHNRKAPSQLRLEDLKAEIAKVSKSSPKQEVSQVTDPIAGDPEPAPVAVGDLPDEDASEPVMDEALTAGSVPVAAWPGEELASRIYNEVNNLRVDYGVWASLGEYVQKTLLGARAVCGQVLGSEDARGRVTIGRYVHPREVFDARIFFAAPRPSGLGGGRTEPEVVLASKDTAIHPLSESVDFFQLPDELVQQTQEPDTPEPMAFLAALYEEIRKVRATQEWSRFSAFAARVLQGAQIMAAQLLSVRDREGQPITVQRYLRLGLTDRRIFNAIGYWRPPNSRPKRKVLS